MQDPNTIICINQPTRTLKNIYLWISLWFVLLIYYIFSLRYGFYLRTADYVVYCVQLMGDTVIGIYGFLSYKKAKDKIAKKFLLFFFVSICVGQFSNEVYNILFNILGLKNTSAHVNEFWLFPYTLFLFMQIFLWSNLLYVIDSEKKIKRRKWFTRFCFFQAAAVILFSILFTSTFKKMFIDPLGAVQLTNTALEAVLFVVLSMSLSRTKSRALSYVAVGILFLLAFNLAHRFSYMAGYYSKAFDVAWLISFVFSLFGFVCFVDCPDKKLDFYKQNSLHVIISSILMLFISILFLLFISLEFFITTVETNAVGQVKILVENMPSVLIFSFTISVIISKLIASKASQPIEEISDRISLIQNKQLDLAEIYNKKYTIYELEKLDKFIVKTIDRLHVANRAKSAFLMNMSHDFRTPASGVYSMSKLIYQKTVDEKLRRFQKLIIGSSGQLLKLLDDVLEYSILDSNVTLPKYININVSDLIKEVILFMSAKVEEKGLAINASLPNVAIHHHGDRMMLYRILVNIISNAIKFTEKGGITITVVRGNTNDLLLTIEDTGIGIDSIHHDSIFDPFVRIESAETSRYPGVGLGLSHVRLMLDKLGGKITLRSGLNKGSTFTIVLPDCD